MSRVNQIAEFFLVNTKRKEWKTFVMYRSAESMEMELNRALLQENFLFATIRTNILMNTETKLKTKAVKFYVLLVVIEIRSVRVRVM